MSPPAGNIIVFFSSVYAHPSVYNATLVRAGSQLTYLLKLCNKKLKFNFAKILQDFG